MQLDVQRDGSSRRLTWTDGGPWHANVFYRVYRHDGPGDDTLCLLSAGVAWYCLLNSEPIATTRDLSFTDEHAPPNATYRVGVGTNWIDDPEAGDVLRSAFRSPFAAEPLLEQCDPLREIDVLVGEPRDDRRVMQEHEEDE